MWVYTALIQALMQSIMIYSKLLAIHFFYLLATLALAKLIFKQIQTKPDKFHSRAKYKTSVLKKTLNKT